MLVLYNEVGIEKSKFWEIPAVNLGDTIKMKIGYNNCIRNIIASIGREQLKVLENQYSKSDIFFEI